MFPAHIFKAYDIRGLVASDLSPALAYRVGRAFTRLLRTKNVGLDGRRIVVGRDMRPSSIEFQRMVMQGIRDEGAEAIDAGLVSTPLFYFSVAHYAEHAGGIMVTASHNPAAYNGFKLVLDNALPIGKNNGMDDMKMLVAGMESLMPPQNLGSAPDVFDPLPDYVSKVFDLVAPHSVKPLKIVIDAGNGMAKATFPELLKHIPITAEYLFLEPDGTFPNHEANPLKTETLEALQAKVKETGADLGFALDGDADRLGLVDEQGAVVDASFVGALIGLEVLRSHGGTGHMLYDLRSSMILKEVWEAAGATTAMCPVGHALIKPILAAENGLFASELSLHQYFSSMSNAESPDLSLLYLLALLSRENKPLSAIVAPLKKYFHSGEINFEIHDKAAVMKKIEERYANEATEISHLDGLYMKFDWGWFNVRASNTEPVLRLNLETRDAALLGEKISEMTSQIP